MRTTLILLLSLLSLNAFADDAPVQPEWHPDAPEKRLNNYVGGMAGLGLVTSTNGGNFFTGTAQAGFGIETGGGIADFGVYLGRASQSDTVQGIKIDQGFTVLMGEYLARRAFGTGLYFGARAGVGFESVTGTLGAISVSGSRTAFAYEPVVGFEFDINKQLTIPLEVSWITLNGGSIAIGNTSATTNAVQAVLIQTGLHFNW